MLFTLLDISAVIAQLEVRSLTQQQASTLRQKIDHICVRIKHILVTRLSNPTHTVLSHVHQLLRTTYVLTPVGNTPTLTTQDKTLLAQQQHFVFGNSVLAIQSEHASIHPDTDMVDECRDLYAMLGLTLIYEQRNVTNNIPDTVQTVRRRYFNKICHKKYYADISDNCPICMGKSHTHAQLSCGHVFCKQCAEEWYTKAHTCALCRADVLHAVTLFPHTQQNFPHTQKNNTI